MKRIYRNRLKKLADHLNNGELFHKKFDFSTWNVNPRNELTSNKCGYAGCAIGECPGVFPRFWKFSLMGNPVLKNNLHNNTMYNIELFFGLELSAAQHLFVPGYQLPSAFGGKVLGDRATRKAVAKNIYKFLERF